MAVVIIIILALSFLRCVLKIFAIISTKKKRDVCKRDMSMCVSISNEECKRENDNNDV